MTESKAETEAWLAKNKRKGGAAPYRQGAALERLVVERLELLGWLAVRAAGSHGPGDVWAARLDAAGRHTTTFLLIQAKGNRKGYFSAKDRQALVNTAHGVGAIPVLATSPPGEGLRFQNLDTEGWMFE